MKYPRSWLKILWLGWLISSFLFLILWKQAYSSRVQSVLQERLLKAEIAEEQLSLAFHSLERLPFLLLSTCIEESQTGNLSPARMGQFRDEASPYARIHWLKPDGSSVFSTESRPAPSDWLLPLITQQLPHLGYEIEVLRPTPAGIGVGRDPAALIQVPDGTPDNYLLWCARDSQGNYLIFEMDLVFIFGDWLENRIHRLGLDSIEISLVEPGSPNPTPPTTENPSTWDFRIPTFFEDTPRPLDEVNLKVRNSERLAAEFSDSLKTLGFGCLTLVGLAMAIVFSGRGLQREMEFVEAKARFTAMVGHELRTPVSAICMYSEILDDGLVEEPEKVSSYHSTLRKESQKLKGLVENLLSYGTLENNALNLSLGAVDVRELLTEIVTSDRTHQSSVILGNHSEQVFVRADRAALHQVFSNLISNGIKYGGKPPVTIEWRTKEQTVEILFKDNGPGIPREQRASIFEPYQRAERPNSSKPGVGLGLALVRGLLQGMNGQVQVHSREGGGSVFQVVLPKERSPETDVTHSTH